MSGPLLSGFHSGSWHRPRVAIVDCRPAAQDLVQEFIRQGYACLHVQSTPFVPGGTRERGYRRADFIADIVHEGELDRTLAAVAAFAPSAVAAGSAAGGPFADLLADSLGLPGNTMTLCQERRDGYRAVETVRLAGLHAVRQVRVHGERQVAEWQRELGRRVVVKSLPGEGTPVRVAYCDTPEQAVAAYRSLAGARSPMRRREVRAVAQEYLPGTEYTLTTVSRDGLHRVCEVWRSSRLSANDVPDLCGALSLLGADAPEVGPLGDFARQVLDALGVRHGPAHLEVRTTPLGPCLLAAGAGLPGARLTGSLAATARLAAGESQVEWAVDAYLRPERFARRAVLPYRPLRYCALVGMVSPVAGVLRSYRGLNRVRELESFHELAFAVRPGEQLRRTVDSRTVPLRVTLRHDVGETVQRDLHTLRHLDGAGMYEVEDGPARAA